MLENPHIITGRQVWAGVLTKGPTGCELNASYATRGSDQYKNELGNVVGKFGEEGGRGQDGCCLVHRQNDQSGKWSGFVGCSVHLLVRERKCVRSAFAFLPFLSLRL